MQVIINADDFGKSPGRNRAVDESFRTGLICSAGLIVTGKHLDEAVDLMNKGGYVKHIHLHLNLSANLMHEDSDDTPLTEAVRKDPFFCVNGKFKQYKGLPQKFSYVWKWKKAYKEIVAQYNKFKEVTGGKADYTHVDFHLWYNLTWPVSIALNLFTRRYNIKTVRYIGMHQIKLRRYRLFRVLSWNPRVKYIPATNIDYFVHKNKLFSKYDVVELYCHPHYKEGVFLDDSPSYLKHERLPLPTQIEMLKDSGIVRFMSWEELPAQYQ